MDYLLLLVLGLFISALGVTNIKGNISKEEDVPKHGKAVGTGTLIMGISLISGYIASLWNEKLVAMIILPTAAVGLGWMLYGQLKYNKGIF